ncbi:MAG TPA: chromate transporter [Candidatus Binatia bacterium]|nr:chromate transporter [Candidatus Binatia bacterium]
MSEAAGVGEPTRHDDHGMAVAVARSAAVAGDGEVARAAGPARVERVSLLEIFRAFLTLGATSFGGGVVAYLRQSLVVREKWLDDETFLAGLELSQTLPGLNATNMSVYVGERLRGAPGALVACLGMMLPGTIVVMTLGIAFLSNARAFDMRSILVGVGSAAVGLLVETTWKISRPVIRGATDVAIAVATLGAVAFLHVSLVVVLLTIAPLAVWIYRPRRSATADDPGSPRGAA